MRGKEGKAQSEFKPAELHGLVITRKTDQAVVIGEDTNHPVVALILRIDRGRVRIKLSAPERILRAEVLGQDQVAKIRSHLPHQ